MKVNGAEFRERALQLAVQSSRPDETPADVVSRADEYCRFLLTPQMSTAVLERWRLVEIDMGGSDTK